MVAEETDTKENRNSTAFVTVNILDVNDNIPKFGQNSYTASVTETAPEGTFVITITVSSLPYLNEGTNVTSSQGQQSSIKH